MAVPFAMPDDDPDATVDYLFAQLYDLLHLLQIQMRRSRQFHSQITPRVRNPAASSRRSRDEPRPREAPDPDRLPDLVNSLTLLASPPNTPNNELDTALPTTQNLPTRSRRRRRRRYASESSCCEEAKATVPSTPDVDVVASQDWTQVGVILRKIADDFQANAINKDEDIAQQAQRQSKSPSCTAESIFSKLVPVPPFSGSICTAVICMVGWHFLWAR